MNKTGKIDVASTKRCFCDFAQKVAILSKITEFCPIFD